MNRVAKTSMYVKNLKMTRNIISTAQKKGQAMHNSSQRRWSLFVWPSEVAGCETHFIDDHIENFA